DLLPTQRRAELLDRTMATICATALVEDGRANWPFAAGPSDHPGAGALRVQHCMGAPGFVNAFAAELPSDPRIDPLLEAAGELIWTAGPLIKLPSLCHGVPGSGYAFLKLGERTGDETWLARARRFAMHAIGQSDRAAEQYGQRKYSLWTGDLGLAIFLSDCIDGRSAFPTLD